MWTFDYDKMETINEHGAVHKLVEIDGKLYGIPYPGREPIKFNTMTQVEYLLWKLDRR